MTAHPMRTQVGALLTALRGPITRTAVADRLGVSRQALMKLEAGGLSLDRLDTVADAYGVEFILLAIPAGSTDRPVWVPPSPAPGLADLVPAGARS